MIELDIEIAKILDDWCTGKQQAWEKAAQKVATSTVNELKAKSRKGRPEYYKGWRKKKVAGSLGSYSFVVHNAKYPGLTHLLEKGHYLWQGGRAKAYPHIKPAEEKAKEEFIKLTEETWGK